MAVHATFPGLRRVVPRRRHGGRRLLAEAIVASLTATALAAIAILLFGRFGETEVRILGTTALLAGYGLLALPAGFLVDRRRGLLLVATVIALSVAGFALAVSAVWSHGGPAALGKAVLTVTAFAVVATQTAALAARRHGRDAPSVRRLFAASVALGLVGAAMLSSAAWAELESGRYTRILAALLVLDVLTVVLQPVLAAGRRGVVAYRLRLTVEDGDEVAARVDAADLAAAAAKAIRRLERSGRHVVTVTVDRGSVGGG